MFFFLLSFTVPQVKKTQEPMKLFVQVDSIVLPGLVYLNPLTSVPGGSERELGHLELGS